MDEVMRSETANSLAVDRLNVTVVQPIRGPQKPFPQCEAGKLRQGCIVQHDGVKRLSLGKANPASKERLAGAGGHIVGLLDGDLLVWVMAHTAPVLGGGDGIGHSPQHGKAGPAGHVRA